MCNAQPTSDKLSFLRVVQCDLSNPKDTDMTAAFASFVMSWFWIYLLIIENSLNLDKMIFYFISFIFNLSERQRDTDRQKWVFQLLVSSPKGRGWVRPKPGAWKSTQTSRVSGRDIIISAITCCHPGRTWAGDWITSPNVSFPYCTTVSAARVLVKNIFEKNKIYSLKDIFQLTSVFF